MTLGVQNVLLAGFVAFVAWGLAVKWIPVLRFLGWSFSLGIIVTLVVVVAATVTTSLPRHRFDDRGFPSTPVPKFLIGKQWKKERRRQIGLQKYSPRQLYEQSFLLSQALSSLLDLVIRDFISAWYGNISKSPRFVNEVDCNIRAALAEIRDRLLKQDLVDIVVERIVPIITLHLHDFDRAEKAVRGRALTRNFTDSEELDLAIAAKFREGKLHPAASLAFSDTKLIQQEHLRKIMVRLLPDVLSETMVGSRAVLVLIKEIVSCAVLYPVVQMLSDPDTWNQIVEAYGRTTLQDRKTVRRMRAALDQHASPTSKLRSVNELPRLAPHDSERAFERLVRVIRKTTNLSDARRYRSQIANQLRRESLVEGQDSTYLRRLEMCKRVLDQKIAKMTATNGNTHTVISQPDLRNGNAVKPRELSLVEIMHTAAGLSCFMEYMDRQGRMSLVQFWIVVDGFRNPLEDDFGDEASLNTLHTWTQTDRTDISQISETYMSNPEIKVPDEGQLAIRDFLVAGRQASQEQYRAARTAILSAQSVVLEELEQRYLPGFRKSDLYHNFLASDEAAAKVARIASTSSVSRSPRNPSQSSLQAEATIRSISQPPSKSKDLRRAALSSNDVKGLASSGLLESTGTQRRSMETASSTPLFDDGYDTDTMAQSNYSVGHDSTADDHADQRRMVENMEAALTNIMTASPSNEPLFDDDDDTLFGSPSGTINTRPTMSPRASYESGRPETINGDRVKPSLATLGLVNTSSRIGVFSDNDLFPDEEKFIEDEYVDADGSHVKDDLEEQIHEAAPGDLGLAEAISALNADIERLVSQEAVVDTLTRKAELTNNLTELRILGKSRASLQREIRRKELQRQQYIIQESDNSLYGRSSISIKSVMVGREDDGREFALYVIEVRREAGDQMPAAVWAIARRYSEFHELHQRLRRHYPSTRNLEFPRRRMVMKLQKQFLHNRRIALEAYLQQLLRMPDVCRSHELRSFLSQQAILSQSDANRASDTQDIVTRIYNSVTDGMDEFLGNIAVLDQLSTAGQNLITAATTQLGMSQNEVVSLEPGSIAEAEAELRAFEDKEIEPFVKPICDVFLELFELNRGNNWLRGRAVVVVLHQLLGGTVERKIRDAVKLLTAENSLVRHIETIKEMMWPGGKQREAKPPRSATEKIQSKKEAGIVLATLVPDLAASVVGRANAQAAARRLSATMNNARLNQHLVFTILDEIIAVLFDGPGRVVARQRSSIPGVVTKGGSSEK